MTDPHPFHDQFARRNLLESIAAKQALKPPVDSQGQSTAPTVLYRYDRFGMLIGPVEPPSDDA